MSYLNGRVTDLIQPGASGVWKAEQFTVEKKDKVSQLGSMYSTGRYVPPGTYTRLMRGGDVVMSDTPDELRDMCEAIRMASGRVLVHGLGLGCALKAMLAKPEVGHIDVVEIDQDVISLTGRYFAGPRCTIHKADCFTKEWPKGTRWNCVWHDIWTNLCGDDLPEHHKLRRRFGRRCDWQGSWGYEFLNRQERAYA